MRPLLSEELCRDLFDFRRDFEHFFSRLTVGRPFLTEPGMLAAGFVPPVDAWIDKEAKQIYLTMLLPGVEPSEVNVQTRGNLLTITGEIKLVPPKKEIEYFYREIPYGTFERTLSLPDGVHSEKLVVEFSHGLMKLTAPLVAGALPHGVEIQTAVKKAG